MGNLIYFCPWCQTMKKAYQYSSFFLNGKYIINKYYISAQDVQRPVKGGLQIKVSYISGTSMKTKIETT
jgi:hypothetical protein